MIRISESPILVEVLVSLGNVVLSEVHAKVNRVRQIQKLHLKLLSCGVSAAYPLRIRLINVHFGHLNETGAMVCVSS